MSKYGYVSIHRQIQEHWLWEAMPFDIRSAWLDILLSANYHNSRLMIGGTLIEIPRGTWFVSIQTLATRWGWSRNRVEHFLGELSKDGMIETKGTARGTLITIVNYGKFQSEGGAKGVAKGEAKRVAEGVAEGETEGEAEGVHPNKGNKGNKGNKRSRTAPPDFDFSEEEMARHDPKDEAYWREALRREREGTLYE